MDRISALRQRLATRGSIVNNPPQEPENTYEESVIREGPDEHEGELSQSQISEMFGFLNEPPQVSQEEPDEEEIEEDEEETEENESSITFQREQVSSVAVEDVAATTITVTGSNGYTTFIEPSSGEPIALHQPNPPEPMEFPRSDGNAPRNREGHDFSTFATARFSGAPWFDAVKNSRITLIGCGGIGSWTALMLARFNPRQIVLYDDDSVEIHNMAGQFFSAENIGWSKANAVAENLKKYAAYYNTLVCTERFLDSNAITDIVITCLDNMQSRRTALEVWKRRVACKNDKSECLFVDGRLSAETLQVFAVRGDDAEGIRRYERTLFSDNEVSEGICSYRQTSFMANMIGSVIANVFVNFLAAKTNPIREIPFKIEYMAEAMYFKTET